MATGLAGFLVDMYLVYNCQYRTPYVKGTAKKAEVYAPMVRIIFQEHPFSLWIWQLALTVV